MRPTTLLALLALAGVLATGAAAGGRAAPGVTATTILLGGTAPPSVARGADAYFRYVNSRGGVGGRAIAYLHADDAGDPMEAMELTRRLVEEEQVFAIFNPVGTEQAEATRGYLNAARVPQLFVGSGATTFGADHARYPWTIGFEPSYRAEGVIYGRYLARTRPRAAVGVLFPAGAWGEAVAAGISRGLAGSRGKVVAVEVVDVDVRAQAARLLSAGADTIALLAAPPDAARGHLRIATSLSAVRPGSLEGALSISFLKDPADPRWRDDPAIRLYRSLLARYARGARASDARHIHGMAVAYQVVQLLKAAGESPTRAAVMARARKLNDASNPFLLPGISVRTSATDRFPVEQMRLRRWSNGRWRGFGGLWG